MSNETNVPPPVVTNISVYEKAAYLVIFSSEGPNKKTIKEALLDQGLSENEARTNTNRMRVRKAKSLILNNTPSYRGVRQSCHLHF